MPRKPSTPAYRLHEPTGQAVVTLGNKDHYLGRHGTPASRAEYDRLMAEWLANGRRAVRVTSSTADATGGRPDGDPTVNDIIFAFWRHAAQHYRKADGTPSSELSNFRDTLRPLRRLFGGTPAREFSPLRLKAVRQTMIDAKLCRNTINQRIGRIVHVFKWAASEELVPPMVHQGLKTVSGLQKGRTAARESSPVRPVPDVLVDAIKPHVSRQVWAMIELQRLTGMRPGEVVIMRTCDVDRSGRVWAYVPSSHKTLHRGKERTVYIGPVAQAVLTTWLRDDATAFLFSPADARAERHASMRARRKTKAQPSQRDRSRRGAIRRPGLRYTTKTYYHAISRACDLAFPHQTLATIKAQDLSAQQRQELASWQKAQRWHPNQLRHSAATRLRKEFGLDVARVILGHTSPAVTEIYAEVDAEKAVNVMERAG